MSAIGKLAGGLVGLVLGTKPSTPAAAAPLPVVDQAAAAQAMANNTADDVRRRRGAGANELTGGGAEASTPGAKVLLGQ